MNETKIPTMLLIKETAKRSGLPEHFIRSAVNDGRIVHIRAGRKILINYDKFIEYLNSGDNGQANKSAV